MMPAEQDSVLQVRSVNRTFAGRRGGGPVRAVQAVSLDVVSGNVVTVEGPSGSGKTTLLRLCGLLDVPDSGDLVLAGTDVGRLGERARARLRSDVIGFVFQDHHLIPHLTAAENVEMALLYRGITRRRRIQAAEAELGRVGLGDRRHHRPDSLSGGEGQRVAIARALVAGPSLLLADEPTAQLDDDAAGEVLTVMTSAADRGAAVVIVTHDARVRPVATRRYRMRSGVLGSAEPLP